MRGDLLGWRFWTEDDFENMDRAVMRRLLKNCKVFVDAGANLGVYSLLASRTCGPAARIFSFEPSPVEFKKLELTVADYMSGQGVERVDFIKIDVEGHELPLLEGAANILKADRPFMMIEMADKRASQVSTPEAIWAHLSGLRYTWLRLDETSGELRVFPKPRAFKSLNLYAIPTEKLDSIR
jgi:hypothetical protein